MGKRKLEAAEENESKRQRLEPQASDMDLDGKYTLLY